MSGTHGSTEQRLWRRVHVCKPSECWTWHGVRTHKGYGIMWPGKKCTERLVHRISWTIAYGPIPKGMCVLHKCDNPPCVNPRHLFLGTIIDNNRDMWAKKRGKIKRSDGENNNSAKLKYCEVLEIRSLRKSGWKLKDIAGKFGVCTSTISWIVSGKHWKESAATVRS